MNEMLLMFAEDRGRDGMEFVWHCRSAAGSRYIV